VTVFVILGICAAVFLILARPLRHAPPQPTPSGPSQAPADDSVPTPAASEPSAEGPTRLLDEKDRIFQALADLRFDYEAGKLSREDFEQENARLRARAAAVLGQLDG
jgi:hypothetical protein